MKGEEQVEPPLVAAIGPTNLADLVAEHSRSRPDEIALVQPGDPRRTLTWAELETAVDALASGLAAAGLVAGHRVALCGANSIEFVTAYFAALRAGFVVVPLNPQATPDELARMLDDSGARVLFSDTGQEVAGVRVVPLTADGLVGLTSPGTQPVTSPPDAEALAVLLYTAGTSGGQRAAMLTHRALLAHLQHVATLGVIGPGTRALAVLPMFHVFGLNAVLGSWVRGGSRLVIMAGLAGDLLAVVADEQVDNLPIAPTIIYRLLGDERLDTALESVTTVVSGAAPLPERVRSAFSARTGLRVEQGYGLTEASPGVSATLGGASLGHQHVGRALPGVEIRIGDGTDASEPAEIWIRGDNLFSGYWPDASDGPGPDGWFATGDIGYLEDGELFLVDRARELIVVNGFNVYPAEVELVVAELPGVDDVAVVGAPDDRTGEHAVVFVAGSGVTAEQVLEHCAERLARFKRPAAVVLLPELPRGATGKIQKGALRARLRRQDGS